MAHAMPCGKGHMSIYNILIPLLIIGAVIWRLRKASPKTRRGILLAIVGAGVGLMVGYLTSPIEDGTMYLTQSQANQALQMAGMHLIIAMVVGLVLGLLLHFLMPSQTAQPKAAQSGNTGAQDMARWNTLVELDPDIAAAAKQARDAGYAYERQLAEKYLAVNDKQYLAAALAHVLEEARLDSEEAQERAQRDSAYPASGTIGNSTFRREADGSYVIVKGFRTGNRFPS